MKTLKLAKDLSLPLDAVTQTFLVVGKRGSGKSNTAARLVEQLHHARLPFVVLDPVDTWWGLKAGRDGEKGLDVYVFGGRRADLPLEAGGGALIAEVLCEHRLSMVLSVKHLSGRERSTFMVAFAQTLFQKWAGGPLCVVLEEAHELAPQSAMNGKEGEQQMLGAFKRLWKLGRASGIGGVAITQRPASLSKDITTQSEILIAHRTIGPQDVKAVGEWVKYHGERLDILAELPTLPTGEAFVWAPEFPEGKPIGLQRTSILLRETYDSASTPKVGEQRVEPKELAEVDLERLRAKMAATIEKAKADDPRELRKQITELQKQVAGKALTAVAVHLEKQKPILTDADRALLEKLGTRLQEIASRLDRQHVEHVDRIAAAIRATVESVMRTLSDQSAATAEEVGRVLEAKGFQKILGKLETVEPPQNYSKTIPSPRKSLSPQEWGERFEAAGHTTPKSAGPRVPANLVHEGGSRDRARPAAEGSLPPGEHATLTAALQYPDGLDRKRLGILTGYKRSSRDAYIARLTQKGLVETRGTFLYPTDAGRASLNGSFEPLPTGAALIAYWRERLPEGERATLDVLLDHGQDDVARDTIDERTGYKRSSRDSYLTRLKARGLVEFSARGLVRASEELFS